MPSYWYHMCTFNNRCDWIELFGKRLPHSIFSHVFHFEYWICGGIFSSHNPSFHHSSFIILHIYRACWTRYVISFPSNFHVIHKFYDWSHMPRIHKVRIYPKILFPTSHDCDVCDIFLWMLLSPHDFVISRF